ncbi:DUF711 family protein [Desulfurococcus mucosus]|uniref:DUF711 family protein n=1 Tax=Desulfurococcus mucosus TaxID=2275 RepID=UPI001FDFD46F|nr:DUF711 family protein [Desulfurococcus mucosus]
MDEGSTVENIEVRAVTYFAGRHRGIREEYEHGINVLERAVEILREQGLRVFTKRVSMPSIGVGEALKLLEVAGNGDALVSAGYIDLRRLTPGDASHLAGGGLYIPILAPVNDFTMDDALHFSRIIHAAAADDPVNATRIAIGFHDESFLTPYFPDSSSRGSRSIGLAFLYPNALDAESIDGLSESMHRVFKVFNNIAELLEKSLGYPVYIDYSLSPWMERSVAGLLGSLGFSPLEPGFNYALHVVNKLIGMHGDRLRAVGFNEVMLPYAEDSVLVEYGGRGLLRARDFLRYASTCVAGVDMIIVPSSVEGLARLTLDAYSLSRVKSRPLSLRAIPVDGEPGGRVRLGRFGEPFIIGY